MIVALRPVPPGAALQLCVMRSTMLSCIPSQSGQPHSKVERQLAYLSQGA